MEISLKRDHRVITSLSRPHPKLLGAAKRVNVNIQDADGLAPLHFAALGGNKELISLLLEAQAAVDIKDHKDSQKEKEKKEKSQARWEI
ncbi:Caskin-1 [Liparis tanakae]|uniref:Caskin-1 n=1 Tax=Liparis tanakae TaxID=230148 RepID=A0A4Z2J789_9TELE|nr:Caskin-1 [Liparis tanakae]